MQETANTKQQVLQLILHVKDAALGWSKDPTFEALVAARLSGCWTQSKQRQGCDGFVLLLHNKYNFLLCKSLAEL